MGVRAVVLVGTRASDEGGALRTLDAKEPPQRDNGCERERGGCSGCALAALRKLREGGEVRGGAVDELERGESAHAELPEELCAAPGEHGVHEEAPALLKPPAAHARHELAPSAGAYLPGAQLKHSEPGESAAVPAEQGAHAVAPAGELCPASHVWHEVEPLASW